MIQIGKGPQGLRSFFCGTMPAGTGSGRENILPIALDACKTGTALFVKTLQIFGFCVIMYTNKTDERSWTRYAYTGSGKLYPDESKVFSG